MMCKKIKIFGIKINIEWYDIRTKLKQLIRKVAYSAIFQEILLYIILLYMIIVYYTSSKKFIYSNRFFKLIESRESVILASWHSRLMMMPFISHISRKINKNHNFVILSSKHGDGRIVGNVMSKFGFINISGSSNAKSNINISDFRRIFSYLKKGLTFAITPDGPNGPKFKINSQIINIARISGAKIIPISYSSSRFIKLKTWDEFIIPLPFSKLTYRFGSVLEVKKNINEEYIIKLNNILEEKLNDITK